MHDGLQRLLWLLGRSTTPTSPYLQNLYDQSAEWGPCYYDSTHVLTSYATYDLPFGRDRQFGKDMNPVVNAIVGDWQVNGFSACTPASR